MDAKDIGSAVSEARKELGLTQEELANMAGLSRTALVAIESGSSTPHKPTRARLATALRRDTNWLMPDPLPPVERPQVYYIGYAQAFFEDFLPSKMPTAGTRYMTNAYFGHDLIGYRANNPRPTEEQERLLADVLDHIDIDTLTKTRQYTPQEQGVWWFGYYAYLAGKPV